MRIMIGCTDIFEQEREIKENVGKTVCVVLDDEGYQKYMKRVSETLKNHGSISIDRYVTEESEDDERF